MLYSPAAIVFNKQKLLESPAEPQTQRGFVKATSCSFPNEFLLPSVG